METNKTPFEEVTQAIPEEEANDHTGHWNIFVDDLDAFVANRLPNIVRTSTDLPAFADNRSAVPYPLPPWEPPGFALVWPMPRFGMISVIEINHAAKQNHLVSAYPWASDGVEHTVRIDRVRLWPTRLEAQIEGAVGNMAIAFFDPQFVRHRAFYRRDDEHQFVLYGLAYAFEACESEPFTMDDPESGKPVTVQTKGMAVFLPAEKGDVDDYQFQGPVKEIEELHAPMLGRRTWRVRVTVARLGKEYDCDFDLDIYVTDKVLNGAPLPKPGDDVRGVLWLNGYLWCPGTWRDKQPQ